MSEPSSPARAPCVQCGGALSWDAAAGKLRCGSCGALRDAPSAGAVIEHELRELLARKPRGGLGSGAREVRCRDCGATVEFPAEVLATRCSFCDSPQVLEAEARKDRLQPESVIPFAVPREAAVQAFRGWLGKLWFRPGDLSGKASVSDLRGVYVPYWAFSAEVTSSWTADAGYNYEEVETVRHENGQVESRSVRRVRWEPAAGTRHDRCDDHLVCASKGLPDAHARTAAGSFDTGGLVAYAPEYLLGLSAETYSVDLPEAWTRGQGEIASEQERRCAGDVPGDTQRSLRASHRFEEVTVKHALLPIWIAAFRYGGRTYRFLVNGQSGKVAGEAPRSWLKIVTFVAILVAAIVALVVLLRR